MYINQKTDYWFTTPTEMYNSAAELICENAKKAIAQSGSFSLALSGGKTPLPVYRKLLDLRFPWDKTDFFWGDERCVSPHDSRSNYFNAMNVFLRHVPVKEGNIHRIKAELPPVEAAVKYAEELYNFKNNNKREKLFDLVLLGMGEDGHTASLFPGSDALLEKEKLVIAVPVPINVIPNVPRVTLTYPALADSTTVLFMVKGEKKKDLLANKKSYPATKVYSEKIIWFVA
jgi:6-phosphogluconolactonase